MMKHLLVFAFAALLAPAALAKEPAKTRRVCGIRWHTALDGAREAAAAVPRKRTARPVFLLRMLGDLTGKT